PARSRAWCRRSWRTDRARRIGDEARLAQVADDPAGVVLRARRDGVEDDVRALRRLGRVGDPGEALWLAPPSPRVHALWGPRLPDRQRRVHEDLDEAIRPDHRPPLVARRPVRADRRAHRDAAVADDLGGHEADAKDVGVAVLLAEAEPAREMRADHVAVEQR